MKLVFGKQLIRMFDGGLTFAWFSSVFHSNCTVLLKLSQDWTFYVLSKTLFTPCSDLGLCQREINKTDFMFCWPCISIHPCNENQLDAQFILSLFRQSTSTCFGHICSPSSGGILYIYNTYHLYIYSIPPDDGLQICPKHVEVDWRNKLWINRASSWFSLHGQ